MAYIQSDIDELKACIKSGVKTVEYHDRKVTYRDLDEMKRILVDMEADVNKGKPRSRTSYAAFDRR